MGGSVRVCWTLYVLLATFGDPGSRIPAHSFCSVLPFSYYSVLKNLSTNCFIGAVLEIIGCCLELFMYCFIEYWSIFGCCYLYCVLYHWSTGWEHNSNQPRIWVLALAQIAPALKMDLLDQMEKSCLEINIAGIKVFPSTWFTSSPRYINKYLLIVITTTSDGSCLGTTDLICSLFYFFLILHYTNTLMIVRLYVDVSVFK